jgi:hypothetical protein
MEDSATLFAKARRLMPGGVNSPVRACREVGCGPLFIASATGATVTSAERLDLIDCHVLWVHASWARSSGRTGGQPPKPFPTRVRFHLFCP